MQSDIILIGPIGAGKSTIGELLAEQLDLPQCSMDDLRWEYYQEIGYNQELADAKRKTEGFWGVSQYWKPFEAYAVKKLLVNHKDCVIDFGAGHSVYEDPKLFESVRQVMAPYPNVILLLPSPDLEVSLSILTERNGDPSEGQRLVNEHLLRHPSNSKLAKFTVYTKSQTPAETCQAILRLVSRK